MLFLSILTGCVGRPVGEEILNPTTTTTQQLPEPESSIGVYHKVNKGETLWRIAKTYDVSVGDIVSSNNIPNVAQIEKNQLIFIPGATAIRKVAIEPDESDSDFVWPAKGQIISYYQERKGKMLNQGIDIKLSPGTLVKSSRSGRVVFADDLTGYGKTVILEHSGGFHTVYAQNGELLVKLDEYVPKDNPIARVGNNNNQSYLHFQIRKNGIENNPLYFLP